MEYIIKYEIDKEKYYIDFIGTKFEDIKNIFKINKDLESIIIHKLLLKNYEKYINNSLIININNNIMNDNDNMFKGKYFIIIESEQKNKCIIQFTII